MSLTCRFRNTILCLLLILLFFFKISSAADIVYALTAPYNTIKDGISAAELSEILAGKTDTDIVVSAETAAQLKDIITAPVILPEEEIVKHVWENNAYSIVPFDKLDPRLKVLAIDGKSPFLIGFDPADYALAFDIPSALQTNYDRSKLTTVTLTGTTAIARNLSYHIETDGLFYPVENIADTLAASDITHISNESSFYSDCPPAVPLRREARFCSSPSYFSILEKIGADIIELTGNHNLDWGEEGYIESLELYEKAGMKTYGGGRTPEAAAAPLRIEHNGNKIAFIGCNAIGPDKALVSDSKPGAAACDREKLKEQIVELKAEGYQVIVTFQHLEHIWYDVPRLQNYDFYWIAKEAAPTIISGSQAHIPQGMTFSNGTFIHFGLGNLLFDQMSDVERTSFFDRHYFYDGRYLGNHLETIILENYSQPRFLTETERDKFLKLIFDTCEWTGVFPK